MGEPMGDEPDEYALVMPFTVVASVGGPYDDDAFSAGFTAGRIDALLLNGIEFEGPVLRRLLPQLDLIAMRYRFELTVSGYDDEWSHIQLRPAPQEAPGG